MAITEGIGAATVGAAGLALLTIEGPESVMIIADYIRKRWVNPWRKSNARKPPKSKPRPDRNAPKPQNN